MIGEGPLKKHLEKIGVGGALVAAGAWVLTVVLSGMGKDAFGFGWNFETTGQLGDSFGVLSSGMASIAAYFAYRTYKAAQEEGRVAERRAFETSFLNLVERRFDVLDRIRSTEVENRGHDFEIHDFRGQEALDRIQGLLQFNMEHHGMRLEDVYQRSTNEVRGLSSYLRFTYHIVASIDRSLPQDEGKIVDKESLGYQLIRLLRAQMTDAELILIALNCVVGSGYGKFRPLVERYALLHNLPEKQIELFRLGEFFKASAFGLSKEDRDAPADMPPQDWLDAMRLDDPVTDVLEK